MIPNLETKRLLLKPIVIEDAAQIQKIFPHWDIVKYLKASSIPWPYPDNGAHIFIENIAIPKMKSGEILTWSIFLKDAPKVLIGAISLMNNTNNNRGFWIDLKYQRRGIISEACEAVVDYWFLKLNKDKLTVQKAKANIASCKVSEKHGMRLIGTETNKYMIGESDTAIFEITKDEWDNYRKK